jgi:hypothetical protein
VLTCLLSSASLPFVTPAWLGNRPIRPNAVQWPMLGAVDSTLCTAGRASIDSPQRLMFAQLLISTPKKPNIHGIEKGKYEISANVGRSARAMYSCPGRASRASNMSHAFNVLAWSLFILLARARYNSRYEDLLCACLGHGLWTLSCWISSQEIEPVFGSRSAGVNPRLAHQLYIFHIKLTRGRPSGRPSTRGPATSPMLSAPSMPR